MKKFTIVALIGLLVLSLAGAVVFAAPGGNQGQPGAFCPSFGPPGQQVNLTDEQKAQINVWQKEMFEHRKQVLQKEVEWGWITQVQADQHIAFMEQQLKDGKLDWGMGPGPRRGPGMGHDRGMGPMPGGCGNANGPAPQ